MRSGFEMLFGTQKINSKGHLEIGGCDTVELAERFGTPLYVMDEALIRQNCREYLNSFRSRYADIAIAFAGKAFLTAAACRIMEQEGLCLDVASAGEMYTALKAGFPPERMYLHGNFKSDGELHMALNEGVGRIVVDNMHELERLDALAQSAGKRADILLRLTPGIDPHTHRLISTGQSDTKFGFNIQDGSSMEAFRRALECPGINLRGIHCHVGSQLLDTDAHTAAARIMIEFARQALDETGFAVEEVNTGGGLGIRYVEGQTPPTIDEFADAVVGTFTRTLSEFDLPNKPKLIQEPGRSIVGTAGTTLYTVGPIKRVLTTEEQGYRMYVAVDGGLSDNPRPLLYDAVYEAIAANKADRAASQTVTICGKHCETDTLISDAKIAEVEPGDILAVQCTGAYNHSMSSNYNRLTRPAVVLVSDGRADVIVEREELDDLVRHDVIPGKLGK
jgi:diaminopimelate decarboxylase